MFGSAKVDKFLQLPNFFRVLLQKMAVFFVFFRVLLQKNEENCHYQTEKCCNVVPLK